MRLLLYNIRYAVGAGASMHVPLPGAGYILGSQTVLPDITEFIRSCDPDIVALATDTPLVPQRPITRLDLNSPENIRDFVVRGMDSRWTA